MGPMVAMGLYLFIHRLNRYSNLFSGVTGCTGPRVGVLTALSVAKSVASHTSHGLVHSDNAGWTGHVHCRSAHVAAARRRQKGMCMCA